MAEPAEQSEPADPQFAEAQADAWNQVLSQLDGDEQLLLYEALDRRISGQQLPSDQSESWSSLVASM